MFRTNPDVGIIEIGIAIEKEMVIRHEKHRRLPPFDRVKEAICVKEDAVAYGYARIDFDSDNDFDPEEIKL